MSAPTAGPQAYRGQRLGLPESGQASLAPTGARLAAWVVDAVASTLVAALFTEGFHSRSHRHGHTGFADRLPGYWSLIPFALDYLIGILVAGRTLGMYLFGLRLIRVDRDEAVNPWRAALRTLLLMLFVPALVFDKDGRGLHDRYTDTAVVRA
jgi:uncharacterized RDD family membrane protein YckC